MALGLVATSSEPWVLDPESYADDQEYAFPMAALLAPEIEKERARLMRSEKAIVYQSLIGEPISRKPSLQVPWYELLAQLDLLTRICDRQLISVESTCTAILRFLKPPNWQVFFWMDKWMEEGGKTAIAVWKFKGMLQDAGAELMAERTARAKIGRDAANALHSKPGGNRDKQAAIRAVWASGKFSSRTLCAEEECASLEMSLDTARRALRNTPDPSPWPAKKPAGRPRKKP